MCEIHIIKRLDNNLNPLDIQEFFNLMSLGSINNSCAFGFFNEDISFKNKGIFNLNGFEKNKKLLKNNFLIGHNRLATTGNKKHNENNHPFKLNEFMLVHNGIIDNDDEIRKKYNIPKKIQTDSYVILYLINHFVRLNNKNITKIKKIKESIKKTTKILKGSFSVFLFDKLDNNIYYFKNDKTYFSFCLLDNKVLIGTTDEKYFNYIYRDEKYIFHYDMFKEKYIKEIDDNSIYLINNDVVIKEIGKFKDNPDDFDCWSVGTTTLPIIKEGCFKDNEKKYDKYMEVYDDYDDYDDYDRLNKQELDREVGYFLNKKIGFIPEFKIYEKQGYIKFKRNKELQGILKEHFEVYYTKKNLMINLDDIMNYTYEHK